MKQCNNRKFQRGFTLIELLVAIAIVGVLTTSIAAILNPLEQFKKARDAQRKQDLRQIQTPLDAYNTDNNHYPSASADNKIQVEIKGVVTVINWGDPWQPYMATVPKDPLSPKPDYLYQSDGQSYRLYAKLENCKDPQKIPEAQCGSYNYSVTSSNIAVVPLPTPTPTPTPRPFKYVFVTSGTYTGDLKTQGAGGGLDPGLDGGDNICKSLADNSRIVSVRGLTWKAWLSTTTVDAKDRVLDKEYRLVDDKTVITTNKAGLLDGDIDNKIDRDEGNNLQSIKEVWTGTKPDGTLAGRPCNSWTGTDQLAYFGNNYFTNGGWTYDIFNNALLRCSNSNSIRLYCFEQ